MSDAKAAIGGPAWAHEMYDYLRGQGVTLSGGVSGRADGVVTSGALRVETDAGWQLVNSAEVSVRPC